MIPKYPTAQEFMGMVQTAIDLGKLSIEAGRKIMEWMRAEELKRQLREAEARDAKDQADIAMFLDSPRGGPRHHPVPKLDFSTAESMWASYRSLYPDSWVNAPALILNPPWLDYCRALTRAGAQCARKPGTESIYCSSHKPDGRCHGATARGDRCQRKTDDYACSSHLSSVTILKA